MGPLVPLGMPMQGITSFFCCVIIHLPNYCCMPAEHDLNRCRSANLKKHARRVSSGSSSRALNMKTELPALLSFYILLRCFLGLGIAFPVCGSCTFLYMVDALYPQPCFSKFCEFSNTNVDRFFGIVDKKTIVHQVVSRKKQSNVKTKSAMRAIVKNMAFETRFSINLSWLLNKVLNKPLIRTYNLSSGSLCVVVTSPGSAVAVFLSSKSAFTAAAP